MVQNAFHFFVSHKAQNGTISCHYSADAFETRFFWTGFNIHKSAFLPTCKQLENFKFSNPQYSKILLSVQNIYWKASVFAPHPVQQTPAKSTTFHRLKARQKHPKTQYRKHSSWCPIFTHFASSSSCGIHPRWRTVNAVESPFPLAP